MTDTIGVPDDTGDTGDTSTTGFTGLPADDAADNTTATMDSPDTTATSTDDGSTTGDSSTGDASMDGSAGDATTDGTAVDTSGDTGDTGDTTGMSTGDVSMGDATGDDAASDGAATADGAASEDDTATAEDTAATDAATGGDGTDTSDVSTTAGDTGSDTGADASSTDGSSDGSTSTSTVDGSAPTTGGAVDPGPPYLFVDVYSGDMGRLAGKQANWTVLAGTKNFVGAILKAWDGVTFNDGGWFRKNWPALKAAAADRYGQTWFRGAYLFLEFLQDGAKQADAYLAAVDAAGGWDAGDLLPIIDVEQGGASHPNRKASAQQIIDCATACANRIRERTQRKVIIYGRGAMRDLKINNRMGCDLVWNPAWTPYMVRTGLEAWSLEEIVLWQYCGDGQAAIQTLPHSVANFGATDLSVFVKGAQRPTIDLVRSNLL